MRMRRIVAATSIASLAILGCDFSALAGGKTSEPVKLQGNRIESFRFPIERNARLSYSIRGYVDQKAQIVRVRIPDTLAAIDAPLVAAIGLSPGANVSPDPGAARSYRGDVAYTVTSEGGTTRRYVVQTSTSTGVVTADLLAFRFLAADNSLLSADAVGTIGGLSVQVKLPYGVINRSRIDLTPTITVAAGATVTPTGRKNFKLPVRYTVTGLDGTRKTYTVSVSVDASTL